MRLAWITLTLFVVAGCGSDPVQRTTYEAIQGAARRDCRQYPSVECPKRESYDDYQRQRNELEK